MTERAAHAAAAAFRFRFGDDPAIAVEVPGRINLIGDHIDYNGLGVLPMAIQRRLTLHVRPRADTRVRCASTDARFAACTFELDTGIVPGRAGDWCNYLRAAAVDCRTHHGELRGFDGLVDSDLPVAAGLSSSSALVVASALALLHINRVDVAQLALAERLAAAEHYAGTRGGGMDQAILLAGRSGCAAQIDFRPLRIVHVPVPAGWCFIVADSGVPAEKADGQRDAYNARAADCAAALATVAAASGQHGATYAQLLASHAVDALIEHARRVLPDLRFRRFRHVVMESTRVAHARLALEHNDAATFGRLMDESHASLRDDFEVGSPALEALVRAARAAGAAGARLTGAGFGGCIVALCTAPSRTRVLQALRAHASDRGPGATVFPAEPSAGATVILRQR